MAALALKLTDAGLAAVTAAAGSDLTIIATLGLTATPFDYAPTLTALPGEFKRIDIQSGIAASPNVTHLTAYDTSTDVWTATGFGLFLDDGTLFAVYTANEPVIAKSGLAFALLAFDIAFSTDIASNIAFGDATFIYPPATEQMRGVAQIATQAVVQAGADDTMIVTALKLAARLLPVMQAISAEAEVRQAGDDTLSQAISEEARVRQSGDDTLSQAVSEEARVRQSGHDALSQAVSSEAAVRQAGDDTLSQAISDEAEVRQAGDDALSGRIDDITPIGNLASKGHVDFPIGNRIFRVNWGKTDVPAKTATTDTFDAGYAECFGVFQGGGSSNPNSTEVIRAYPGTGQQAFTHVNLTNGMATLITIHWLAIGIV